MFKGVQCLWLIRKCNPSVYKGNSKQTDNNKQSLATTYHSNNQPLLFPHILPPKTPLHMHNLTRHKPIDQTSDYMQTLCKKNETAVSSCGYITLAIIEHLTELQDFKGEADIAAINQYNMTEHIEKVMGTLKKSRKMEVKKFWNQMNQSQRKNYLKDWVANFEIVDYLESIAEKMLNTQVYFFRQCAYDHPQAMTNVKWEESQRVKQELQFKGQGFFYTRFTPTKQNLPKDNFIQEITKCDLNKPIIIATDVLGHYNVTILFDSKVFVVDSLSTKGTNYDHYIVEYIHTSYKRAIEKVAMQA